MKGKKEHIREITLKKETTALAKKNLITALQVKTLEREKISDYGNMHNALLREAIEIYISKSKLRNNMTHALTNWRWIKILEEKKIGNDKRKSRESADLEKR